MDFEYALFDTPLGACGIAWSGQGIRRLQLPEASPKHTEKKLVTGLGKPLRTAPPEWVREAQLRVARHLAGAAQDFAEIRLDLDGLPPFHRRVYEAARAAGPGKTLTYGEMAAQAGSPGASRAVGQALARNPFPLLVPCHRVLASGNRPGGFSAYGGAVTKARLLALEGVVLPTPGERPLPFDGEEAVRTLAQADPQLGRLMDAAGPLQLTVRSAPPFQALVRSIVYQQLAGKAAAAIHGRVLALFPGKRMTPAGLLAMPADTLRGAGLSGAKLAAMQDLARKVLDGTIPTSQALKRLTDAEIIERLTLVRGVGPWTVEMMLMFRMGRPDVLPVDDYGVRKGFSLTYGLSELPTRKELLAHGERWRPYRTVASWYLWRAVDLPPDVQAQLARAATQKRPRVKSK